MAKIPTVHHDTWQGLYDAALTFAQLGPWELLSDRDLFALRSPIDGEMLYGCTIGQEKISYGLLLYRGEEGYGAYKWLAEEEGAEADIDGYVVRQNQLSLNFVPKKELDKGDRAVIKNLGWNKVKAPVWPQFRSQRPYGPLWYVEEKEAVLLTLALICGVDFVGRIMEGQLTLPFPAGQIPTYDLPELDHRKFPKTLAPPVLTEPPIHRPLPPQPLILDQNRIKEISKTIKGTGGAWEADISNMDMVISGGERPYIPFLFLAADQYSGFILDSQVSEPSGGPHQVLADGLLNAMEKNQVKPSTIFVKRGTLAAGLAPLAKALNIPIQEAKQLQMIETARRAMKKHFAPR